MLNIDITAQSLTNHPYTCLPNRLALAYEGVAIEYTEPLRKMQCFCIVSQFSGQVVANCELHNKNTFSRRVRCNGSFNKVLKPG